jgi:hypothetical protein
MTEQSKYPHIKVQLVGEDGNAFSILGRVAKAMRQAGVSVELIDELREALSGVHLDSKLRAEIAGEEERARRLATTEDEKASQAHADRFIGNLLQSQEVTPSSHHSIMRWLLESAE